MNARNGNVIGSITALLSAAVMGLSAWYVGLPAIYQVLMVLIGLDIASGIIAALYKRRFSMKKGLDGILKKGMVIVVLGAAAALGKQADVALGEMVAVVFCGWEALSILRNAAILGLPQIPVLSDLAERMAGTPQRREED